MALQILTCTNISATATILVSILAAFLVLDTSPMGTLLCGDMLLYSALTPKIDASRAAYEQRSGSHRAEMRALDARQKHYYDENVGGYFPTAYRELKPLAREVADDALEGARAREDLYSRGPTMYQTPRGQDLHRGYIRNRYAEADTAELNYMDHSLYEDDPECDEVDCYGRRVPRGFKPDPVPYGVRKPRDGHYSKQLDAEKQLVVEDFPPLPGIQERRGRH
ncbi:MAG: hypothetical protein Q9221_007684 [Calogaya cf. arnoldii]